MQSFALILICCCDFDAAFTIPSYSPIGRQLNFRERSDLFVRDTAILGELRHFRCQQLKQSVLGTLGRIQGSAPRLKASPPHQHHYPQPPPPGTDSRPRRQSSAPSGSPATRAEIWPTRPRPSTRAAPRSPPRRRRPRRPILKRRPRWRRRLGRRRQRRRRWRRRRRRRVTSPDCSAAIRQIAWPRPLRAPRRCCWSRSRR